MAGSPQTGISIPVICLENQPDVWASARASLEERGAFVLVKSPASVTEVVSLSNRIGPAILLTGADFFERLTRSETQSLLTLGTLCVLIVNSVAPDEQAAEVYIRKGCCGTIHLDDGPDTWRKAVRSVAAGELWLSRRGTARILRELLGSEQAGHSRKLTTRETEVLALIASGYTNKDIASHLFITKETVRWHLRSLYSKLGVNDRGGAIQRWRSKSSNPALK